ncbi:acetate/propionate family kinase [Pseudokineococcus lusitanus]|uniref:Acetate kinase n=1 Tax=Pseudokineococcus lusitanus TaxID=763993 RepID=A0A3N1HL13_9ACTN|nr:acetate kinase [Pseudokineococcus lusitanus]ROP43149.1 acetate kinase [Pseudokineococcus lusitanus]
MSGAVLVVNSGSSSVKYELVEVTGVEDGVPTGRTLAVGLVERIGTEGAAHLRHRRPGTDGAAASTAESDLDAPDHAAALAAVVEAFAAHGPDLGEAGLVAVGHRVVHGGERFSAPALVDDDLEQAVEELAALAPLHNPANLEGIRVARRAVPDVPHVAVFDTAFHATVPPAAHTYALDRALARRHGVRRYGFHGTSVASVVPRAAAVLGRPVEDLAVVVLHLGNGASATAVLGGRSVETSMGLTPLEGLVMGTRPGDVDPGALLHLLRAGGLSVDELDTLLNRRSGLLGLAGASDLREVERRAGEGDDDAALALDVLAHRVRHYLGAYAFAMGRLDAVVLTAGVGENSAGVRARALDGLAGFGVVVDEERNAERSDRPRRISPDWSPVAVLVVPTAEELQIAHEALGVVGGG